MNNEYHEDKFLETLRNIPRASPPPEVWENIERITAEGATIRSLSRADWQRTAAAAAVVIFLNTAAVFWSLGKESGVASVTAENNITLVSDYELYE